MRRIERQYGIGFWPLSHLRKGNAKTCDIGLYGRLAGAYLDLCDRLVSRLQEEMKIEAAIGDDSLGDIEIEAGILAAKIAQKKAALVGRKG